MRDLKTVAGELARVAEILKMTPDEYPANTRAAFSIRARQAEDTVVALRKEYKELLIRDSVTVFLVDSEHTPGFIKVAQAEGVEVVVDASKVYRTIAAQVWPSIGNYLVFGPSQYSLTIQRALSVAYDLGIKIVEANTATAFANKACNNRDELLQIVRTLVRKDLGDAIAQEAFVRDLADSSYGAAVKAPVPILVHGIGSTDEAAALHAAWPSNGRVIIASETPTNDDVVELYEELRTTMPGALKKSKKNVKTEGTKKESNKGAAEQ